MFDSILRLGIICLSLTLYPYILNKVLYTYYNDHSSEDCAIDRVWVFLNLVAQLLWFLYAIIVNEWILVFTGTFNTMVLIVTLVYNMRNRYKHLRIPPIKPSETCPFLLADSLLATPARQK
jgi:hypothetical protein